MKTAFLLRVKTRDFRAVISMINTVKRGEVYYADLNPAMGSEQGGVRPVLVIQNNTGNQYSTTVIVAAITASKATDIPTHVPIQLNRKSVIMLEQIRTIDKARLSRKIHELSCSEMQKVDRALQVSLGLASTSSEETTLVVS